MYKKPNNFYYINNYEPCKQKQIPFQITKQLKTAGARNKTSLESRIWN